MQFFFWEEMFEGSVQKKHTNRVARWYIFIPKIPIWIPF
jgi:hypothetical protein